MYKDRVKRVLRFILLMSIIVCIIVFIIVYFISGPIIIDKINDEKLLDKVEESYKFSGCSLINRFSDDKVYYIAKCVAHYIVYDDKGLILTKEVVQDFDKTKTSFIVDGYDISIGYYNNNLVYVLKSENREVLFDYSTYDILRDYTIGR